MAFAGLAAVTLATSGAFACSPQAGIIIAPPGEAPPSSMDLAAPGQQVDLRFDRFYDPAEERSKDYSPVRVVWYDPFRATETFIAARPGPSFVIEDWQIPADSQPTTGHSTMYEVVATQTKANGEPAARKPIPIYVGQRASSGPVVTPPGGGTTDIPLPNGSPVRNDVPSPEAVPVPVAAPPIVVPAPADQAVVAPRAGAPRAVEPPVATEGSVGAARPSEQVVPVAAEPIPPAPVALPVPDDLWSGVQAGRTLNLLDPPNQPPPTDSPTGTILLGAGVMAMAGVAVASGRRRLAVRRSTRR